ncbi:MAG TPA: hypothetical protein VGP68_19995 [Gemmataceae bacterium]|jgi:hypothetical protein|nr:hypothetical protein [Gemmataceae bacterium]
MSSQPLVESLTRADASLTDRILRPFRIVLAKLLRPMLWREEELIGSLEYHLEQIQQQQRQLAALVRQVGPDDTRDRLIAFEERIQQLEAETARGSR